VSDQPAASPSGAAGAVIDTEHLSRMTLGELSLQREVLALFDRQADMLLPRIRGGAPAMAATSAHTLKGSAVGIGAFKVARAVEQVEQAQSLENRDAQIDAAVATLAAVLEEAKAEIARLLLAA
jgi:HPt (histidine-containing phosphotransfer) domain-containing protein